MTAGISNSGRRRPILTRSSDRKIWMVLAGGLTLTLLLALYLTTLIQRAVRIAHLDAARARELRERRRAEAALHDSEARFRALVQHSSDVIVSLDAAGGITYVSPAVRRVLGYDVDGMTGSELARLAHSVRTTAMHSSRAIARRQAGGNHDHHR